MLSIEAFVRRKREISKSVSGFRLPQIAREIAPGVVVKKSRAGTYYRRAKDRNYQLVRKGEVIKMEGYVLPQNHLGRVERMQSLEIRENGAVFSDGERVSPHDPRLALTTGDLIAGEEISEDSYESGASDIQPY